MNSPKSTFIGLTAALITACVLFAFKSNEPIKQYATLQFHESIKEKAIIVTQNGELKEISTPIPNDEKKFLETLNQLVADGWKVNTTDYAFTGTHAKRVVYLERIK